MRNNYIAITFNISREKWPLCRVCQCGSLNEGETIFLPDNESGAQFCGKFHKTFLHNLRCHRRIASTREVLMRGRLNTVDLLLPTSIDQLFLVLKILLNSFTKQATLMRRSTLLSLPP